MNTGWKALAVTGALAALTVSIFVDVPGTTSLRSLVPSMTASVSDIFTSTHDESYVVPPLGDTYHNTTYGFSLALPHGFTAQEMSNDAGGGQTIVLQDTHGNAIHIIVTPFVEDVKQLTVERIRADMPDVTITDAQPVEIGPDHTGVAFKSNGAAQGSASREVWFVFRGHLYKVSAHEESDPLLKALFTTWQFE